MTLFKLPNSEGADEKDIGNGCNRANRLGVNHGLAQ